MPKKWQLPPKGGHMDLDSGVYFQNMLGILHEGPDFARPSPLRQITVDILTGYVMGWRCNHGLFTVTPHKQMAVTHSGEELIILISQFTVEVVDDRRRFGTGNMTGGKIVHDRVIAIIQGDKIAAEGDILRTKNDAHVGCFQRTTTGVTAPGIVTQNGKIGNVASRLKTLGNRIYQTQGSFTGHEIHMNRPGSL